MLYVFYPASYATNFIKSKQGHFLQRLHSAFLYFLQHLGLTLPKASSPEFLRIFIRSFLSFLFFVLLTEYAYKSEQK